MFVSSPCPTDHVSQRRADHHRTSRCFYITRSIRPLFTAFVFGLSKKFAAKLRQIAVGYDAELYINQQYRVFALALKEITCCVHSDLFLIHSASMILSAWRSFDFFSSLRLSISLTAPKASPRRVSPTRRMVYLLVAGASFSGKRT